MSTRTPAVDQAVRALVRPGRAPAVHRAALRQLRAGWPTLADALAQFVEEAGAVAAGRAEGRPVSADVCAGCAEDRDGPHPVHGCMCCPAGPHEPCRPWCQEVG